MKKTQVLVIGLFLLMSTAVMADDIDHLPGVGVTRDGIEATPEAIVNLGKDYALVQFVNAQNTGIITTTVTYVDGKLKVSDDTEVTITGSATGNFAGTKIDVNKRVSLEGFKSAMIIRQINDGAIIKSDGNFDKSLGLKENKGIFATGNLATYEDGNEENPK